MKSRLRILLYLFATISTAFSGGCAGEQQQQRPGHPSRSADFDALPGFVSPPAGYGEVPFYWWMGDTLTREHLTWHLDLLQKKGISSLQVNYAHSDKGGRAWGLTFKSKPELFSEEWWDLFGWFMKEAKKRGMTVSLSDYTLGVGQESYVDEALHEHPEVIGHELHFDKKEFGKTLTWSFTEKPLSLTAYRTDGRKRIVPDSQTDLTPEIRDNKIEWKASDNGQWVAFAVISRKKDPSFDPMHPISGKIYVEHFFQKFEDRFPELSKGGINFFFSDELNFQLGNLIWNDIFRDEFNKRKGYDIVPYLPALFTDIGDITPKIRLDYNDVMVSLSEEHFFKPVYDWHEQRGLIYGCDHGGRGRDVTEFGDYFRTQRWNQAPGCDEPGLARDIIKNKVASSISHLYERPRVWLEGFYGSGWGTSSDALTDAIFANFTMGHNLLSLHGLYYSTPGGWWEWAPPCNHFRMPYWEIMEPLLRCSERLSFLLSQGIHRADVALLYPTEPVAAGYGNKAVETAFSLANDLYNRGIDFDFMDYESLQRAEIKDRELQVAGEKFKVLILPSMKAIKHASLEKAAAFKAAGGIVICAGDLPEATDRAGANDPQIREMNDRLFGSPEGPGKGVVLNGNREIAEYISQAFPRDFKIVAGTGDIRPYVYHRKIGPRDLYAVYNTPKGTSCFFRCKGGVEVWDPWTGATRPLEVTEVSEEGTTLKLPLGEKEIQLIVFDPSKEALPESSPESIKTETVTLNGNWDFELKPVLDNRFGDFHWPATDALIGAEIRRLDYTDAPEKNSWIKQSTGYGPRFMILEGLPAPLDETKLQPGTSPGWKPYEFSWRWGVENDYGHQGYHGLKTEMYDDFIRLGDIRQEATGKVRAAKPEGNYYYLYTNLIAGYEGEYEAEYGKILPAVMYLNGESIVPGTKSLPLKKGANPVLLRYDTAGTTYFVALDKKEKRRFVEETLAERPVSMRWNGDLSVVPFDIRKPDGTGRAFFRFTAAPGLESLEFEAYGKDVSVTADGIPCKITAKRERNDGLVAYEAVLQKRATGEANISIEIGETAAGQTGGAALPNPIRQHCGKGTIACGDWSEREGLTAYSGGGVYSREFEWNPKTQAEKVILDLGEVASAATVTVNGKKAGIRLARPYTFDLTEIIKNGRNKIEITVYNTAANHYTSIPTNYRGSVRSGLIGPVRITATSTN